MHVLGLTAFDTPDSVCNCCWYDHALQVTLSLLKEMARVVKAVSEMGVAAVRNELSECVLPRPSQSTN